MRRDSERIELMIGEGILEDKKDNTVFYPVLLKKAFIEFNAEENIIIVKDSEKNSELNITFLQGMKNRNINSEAVKTAQKELEENLYHPLEENTHQFLKGFTHSLDSYSRYLENEKEKPNEKDEIVVYCNPVLFVREKISGVLRSLDLTIKEIEENQKIEGPLLNFLTGKEDKPKQEEKIDLREELSLARGEDKDILLSKDANKEQLEIAKNIEKYNAVVVQGPPGTGKTHTIANLMGHFLAQGKNILVTSQTKKALSVVKEKVVPELQSLCVSLLEENNTDMEQSIDSITEYVSYHTPEEILQEVKKYEVQRQTILKELEHTRNRIYSMQQKEYESIVIAGESYHVIEAAKFVKENEKTLCYLPGEVKLYKPLPLSMEELKFLYETNGRISQEEEFELQHDLPAPDMILNPEEFVEILEKRKEASKKIVQLQKEVTENRIVIDLENNFVTIKENPLYVNLNQHKLIELKKFCDQNERKDFLQWQIDAILAGKEENGYKIAWKNFAEKIKEAYIFSNDAMPKIVGKTINVEMEDISEKNMQAIEEMKEFFAKGKKINGFITFTLHKDWKELYNRVRINQQPLSGAEDCEILVTYMKLILLRNEIKEFWNALIENKEGISYASLGKEPEREGITIAKQIEECLNWYDVIYKPLQTLFLECGFSSKCLQINDDMSATKQIKADIDFIYQFLSKYVSIAEIMGIQLPFYKTKLNETMIILKSKMESVICKNLMMAMEKEDIETYQREYDLLNIVYDKNAEYNKRYALLEQIASDAPQWSEAIQKRMGIHGLSELPKDIESAWKWKQLYFIIEDITKQPFEELQKKVLSFSEELQKVTARLAEKKAWYALLQNIEKDETQQQNLKMWKETVKKIGKGTGKRAPKRRREAQKLMAKCQKSVPAWIMSISQALENLDPKENKFDIVIIDEASQADISALAILYLAKKVIIVGDNEQVSPSNIGIEIDKMDHLINMYLKGKIPNASLYDGNSSLYDIAAIMFKTLMLKEHFRCVPDIIGYSNRLSYDYKIKPLREDSGVSVKPATISYRVNGKRDDYKRNEEEAKNIVALMLACMEQPEYENMTFGAISLLAKPQADLIERYALEKINPKLYHQRNILCGDASLFQGDERDVIFISLVDSNEGEGPLMMRGFGANNAIKQRYNVAMSRAKNQVWVVHSLDVNNDLKPGDLRKDLIEYVANPNHFQEQIKKIESAADSSFEISVASTLVKNGYHIIQQWAVGAYRIDMVAVCGNKKIAIECDGELYHAGEDKIREDMERQAILERLGWRFIRIRGSEYYRNPEETMKRVMSECTSFGIEPEENTSDITSKNMALKEKVIRRAVQIMEQWAKEKDA